MKAGKFSPNSKFTTGTLSGHEQKEEAKEKQVGSCSLMRALISSVTSPKLRRLKVIQRSKEGIYKAS